MSGYLNKLTTRDTKFDTMDWVRLGCTGAIIALGAIDMFLVNRGEKPTDEFYRKNVSQFTYHAYDLNNHGDIHGPFMGKVRLARDDMSVGYASHNNDAKNDNIMKMKQTACDRADGIVTKNTINGSIAYVPINSPLMDKCKMMRTPDMFFGKVHSSWSVLGAQSIYTLVKHIGFILIAFLVFSWVEDQILTHKPANLVEKVVQEKYNYFRAHFRFMRSVTIIIVIALFTLNIGLDIKHDMHSVDSSHENSVAIGSISTGFSFCLVSILIICISHLDEPYSDDANVESTPAKIEMGETANNGDNTAKLADVDVAVPTDQINGSNSYLMPQQYNFAQHARQFRGPLQVKLPLFGNEVDFIDGNVHWSDQAKFRALTQESAPHMKLQAIYRNIHVSYLMLLLFPLVSMLALVRSENKVVDVHVQLIFFSSIFFAVLDVFQSRVSSVLASFTEENSIKTGIGEIKTFVVLAFILAKLFVFVPAFQLTVVYYTKTDHLEFGLVLTQLLVLAVLSALDLFYVVGGVGMFIPKEKLVGAYLEARVVDVRQLLFFVYLGYLTITLFIV
jgi:hypothetical protein